MSNKSHQEVARKKHYVLSLFGILFLLLLCIVFYFLFFPAPIARFVLARLETKTGIAVTFEKTYFNLGKRALTFENVTAKRQNHPESNFDFQAATVHVDIPPQSKHPNGAFFLTVSALRGTYERTGKDGRNERKDNGNKANKPSWQSRKKLLCLTDSEIVFIDKTLPQPFQATISFPNFDVTQFPHADNASMFGEYSLRGGGHINATTFFGIATNESLLQPVPIEMIAPYLPILNDIFLTGSVSINMNDLTTEKQKLVLVKLYFSKDCQFKSADEILVPSIQSALRHLDQSSMPTLPELREKMGHLKTVSQSLRVEIDKVAPIVEALSALAPREVREKYDRLRRQYDRLRNTPDELEAKLNVLLHDLDKMKTNLLADTLQHFIETRTPIEFYAKEIDGRWHADWEDAVVRLIEQNYQTLIADEYQMRIRELLDSVNQLLAQ